MKFADLKILALLAVIGAVSALAFAYVAQYGFNLQPCILCLYQRKPFFAVIALGLAAYFLPRKYTFWFLLLISLAYAIGAGIAGFHTGVEHGWWKGLDACGDSQLPENASLEEMKQYLLNRPVVRCDVPAWMLFGLSMSGYNFLYSTFLSVFIFCFAIKGRQK